MDPKGAQFRLPMPLLWQHNQERPIGQVFSARVTPQGIEIKASIAKIQEPGPLKDFIDMSWQSLKAGLVRGLSIGWRLIDFKRTTEGFRHVLKWMWMETSAVTIPANANATIQLIKSLDIGLPAPGTESDVTPEQPAGVSAHRTVKRNTKPMAKTYSEQIKEFEATRAAKEAERAAIQTKASDEGRTKDESEKEQFDTLTSEIKAIDQELVDLRELEKTMVSQAKAVAGNTPEDASKSRGVVSYARVSNDLPPGIQLARAILCKAAAVQSGGAHSPVDFAKARYPDDQRIQMYLKAPVSAGTTTDSTSYGPLVDQVNLVSEFLEYLRPMTIIGRLPGLRRVPFNIRYLAQSSAATASWVGEGAAKPLTDFNVEASTLLYTKIAAIAVITDELARFSSPSAEAIVRDELARAIVERMDTDFIDPAISASAGVRPASITNGVTPLTTAGTSADNIRTDIQNLLEQFILNNVDPTGLVLIMPNTLALAASILHTDLAQPEFPGLSMTGGTLMGIPVITSQYAANASSYGNLVIAVNTRDIFLADDGSVDISVSREASLSMDGAPSMNSTTPTAAQLVSMWQTNSLAIKAERYINWKKARTNAVSFMDDVNWGAIGSPV